MRVLKYALLALVLGAPALGCGDSKPSTPTTAPPNVDENGKPKPGKPQRPSN
jgi:hypothetical protein